jgi:hypothetical protein
MISNYNKFFKEKQMRDILNLLESVLDEATLEPSQIIKYPERFDAFITHIQDGKPFYTTSGEEVILDPSEAKRFLDLKNKGLFKGGLVGVDLNGQEHRLSNFEKTIEFGGASVKPGEDTGSSKEGALVKPTQIGITDRPIMAGDLGSEIASNPILNSTPYGQAVAQMADAIVNGAPAVIPPEFAKTESIKKAIVDYAGEYLGVLALVNNQTNFPNKKEFLQWLGGDLSGLTLNFPSKINNQIADSFASIINPTTQHQINISSKGTGGGAPPSLSGLVIPPSVREKKEYQTAVDFIELCQNKNLPKPTTISQVFQAMNLLEERVPDAVPQEFKKFLPWSREIVAQVRDSLKNGTPMPKYKKLFANLQSKGNDGGKLTYVVKDAVMEAVNGGAVPEFQAAILETLDYNFIQQYTKMGRGGQLQFDTQWPAKLNGIVSLETKSGGTDPTKGGFSFKLKPKGSPATGMPPYDSDTPGDEQPFSKTTAADLDAYSQQSSGLKASAGGVEKKFGSEKTLGRKRQR